MNVLFLTTGRMDSIEQHAIYPDLLRCFRDNGHNVCVVSAYEKRLGKATQLVEENGAKMLHVRIGNLTKTNIIEKGFSTIAIKQQYLSAIKRFFPDTKFDLVMYSTPPITLVNVVKYVKKRDNAKTYLLLKDIFPQNAVDLNMMTDRGLKGFIYKYFRKQEKKLYELSDYIGCMSPENVNYVLKHNPEISSEKVEVCPNSVEVIDMRADEASKLEIRKKYDIPLNKKIFVYGGNLGKPQGIDFVIKCLKSQQDNDEVFFLIVGDGTEYGKIEEYVKSEKPINVRLMKKLPKNDYDKMIASCDVGMIFLDHRFTIPNFPSRLLSYMQAGLPVLAVTDTNTDVGKVAVDGGFGWWCESNDEEQFRLAVEKVISADRNHMGNIGYEFLNKYYTVQKAYDIIINGHQWQAR